MAKDPAFLFYSSDFLSGITDLTMEERGQFITLLCVQHQKGFLTEKTIRLLVGSISVDVISKFRLDENGNYFNERLKQETEKRNQFTESRRNNGNLGGRPKKTTSKKQNHMVNHMVNHMENENEDVNENINEIEIYPTFDDFWNDYDKKVGKKDFIKKKWDKLSQETKEKIISFIPNYKISQSDKKFRKNPETFFNNETWNDELILSNNNGKQQNNNNTGGASEAFRRKTAERLGLIQPD